MLAVRRRRRLRRPLGRRCVVDDFRPGVRAVVAVSVGIDRPDAAAAVGDEGWGLTQVEKRRS